MLECGISKNKYWRVSGICRDPLLIFLGENMDEKEKLINELESLRKNFGLTDEEVEGYFDFFYKDEKSKSKRVLNTDRSKF